MAKLSAAFFDFDGTLFDSYGKNNFVSAARILGWDLPDNTEEVVLSPQNFGKNAQQLMHIIWPDITQEKVDEFQRAWEILDKAILEPYPGTRSVLNFLKYNNIHAGVITHRRQQSLLEILQHNGFLSLLNFELLQGIDAYEFHKPDPRVFDAVLAKLVEIGVDIHKNKIIYVGDSEVDAACTLATNIEFVGVETSSMDKEQFVKLGVAPENVIARVSLLSDWIEEKGYV